MRTLLSLIPFLFVLASAGVAQELTLYQNDKGQRFTPTELDTALADVQRKVDKLDMIARIQIVEEFTDGDTLIKAFTLDIASRALVEKEEKRAAFIGKPLPPFELKDLDGNTLTAEDLKGKVTLINFWFTRCAPCIAEMPALNELRAQYPAEDYRFVAMAPEGPEEIRAFLERRDFDFYHLHSAGPYIEAFSGEYPLNVLLDAEGNVRAITDGLASLNADTGQSEVDPAPLIELLDALGEERGK